MESAVAGATAPTGIKYIYIQTQPGHASPTITLNVYAHLMQPTNQEATCRLENAIFGKDDSKMVAGKEKGLQSETITP